MQLLNKFHAICRTQKFHCHVHKSLPMNPVPIKMNSVRTFTSDFFLVHLLLQRGLIPLWWLPNILYAFLIFSIVLHAASMLYSLEFSWFPELLRTWSCFVTCLFKGIWVPLFYGIGWPIILLYAWFNWFLSPVIQIVFFRVLGRWWWCWWFYGRSIRECPRGTAGKIINQWSRFSQWTEQ